MRLSDGSLVYRAGHRSLVWLAGAASASIVARSASALARAVGSAMHGSVVFTTSNIRSVPLEAPGQALAVRAVARPYVWLRGVLAEGATGRAVSRFGDWIRCSAFGHGTWVRLLGATLLGTAIGRAVQGQVTAPIVMGLVGFGALAMGPMLLVALGDSTLSLALSGQRRSVSQARDDISTASHSRGLMGAAIVICAVSGVAAGLAGSSGPLWLFAGILGLAAAAALLWRPEGILLAAAAFPWLDTLAREGSGRFGAAWDETLLIVSLALILWGAVVTGRIRLRTVPILLPVLCAFTAAVGSVVVGGVRSDIGLFALRVTFEPLLFYFVGFLLFTTVGWVRRVVAVFLVSTTGLAIHGLYQYVTHVPTPSKWVSPDETEIVTRAFSVIGNPNGLGSVLAIGILVSVALLLSREGGRRVKLALGIGAAVQVAGLAVTFSRGAWLGTLCGLIALLVLAHRRYLIPVFLAGAVGLLAVPKTFVDRFLVIFSKEYLAVAAIDGRIYRWNLAVDQISAHPLFGVGLGTFGGSSAEKFGYWSTWVDNFYLQMGAEGGLILLLAFLWLMLRVAKGLLKGARESADPYVRALAAGVFAALIAVAVANVFASVFETLAVGAGLWLLAGLATSAGLAQLTPTQE